MKENTYAYPKSRKKGKIEIKNQSPWQITNTKDERMKILFVVHTERIDLIYNTVLVCGRRATWRGVGDRPLTGSIKNIQRNNDSHQHLLAYGQWILQHQMPHIHSSHLRADFLESRCPCTPPAKPSNSRLHVSMIFKVFLTFVYFLLFCKRKFLMINKHSITPPNKAVSWLHSYKLCLD